MPAVPVTNVVIGSNINTLGDSGTFEALAASWGATFNVFPDHTVTRSSTVAYAGTYSARVQAVSTDFGIVIDNIASHEISDFKTYIASCYVYMPSVNPFVSAGQGLPYFSLTRTGNNGTSLISDTGAIYAVNNTWARLEIKYRSSSSFPDICNLRLVVSRGSLQGGGGEPSSVVFNGLLYVDQFEIREYTETTINYQVDTVVLPAQGSNSATGSITINVNPSGSYLYGNDGISGSIGASNVFNSLLPRTYNCVVQFPATPSPYNHPLNITVPGLPPQWTLSYSSTNETSPGASDGTITGSVSSSYGSPYVHSIYLPSGLVGTNGTGIFTSLDPGTYYYQVSDTFSNIISATVIVGGITCALIFNTAQTVVTNATNSTTADGQIQVVANDPLFGGLYQYKLGNDFIYGSEPNTSGLFTGLLPGYYVIFARTSTSCSSYISVIIGTNDIFYGVKYRLVFSQIAVERFYNSNFFLNNFGTRPQFRLDILERNYAGAIIEVKADTTPVIYSWRGEGEQDPFKLTVVPLDIKVNLLSITPQQFIELYTSDETKYKFQFYLYNYDTSDTLLCQGFGVSQLYAEEYGQANNYPVTFRATDRLADLSKFEFTDNNGNRPVGRISVLKAVTFCLNKTGLQMDIRDKVNIYCPGMGISLSDGSLTQIYFDTNVYRNDDGSMQNCKEVLTSLLKGCSLFQAEGIWHIETISEKCASVTNYQQYDYLGNYLSSGTENNRIKIRPNTGTSPKLMFADSSQKLRIAEGYGAVNITYDLGIENENNLLTNSKFEAIDLTTGQLRGWTATFASPIEVKIELPPSRGLSFRFDPYTASSDALLIADPVQIKLLNGKTNRFKLVFDVYTRPFNTEGYLYIDYRLRITGTASGDFYLQKTPFAARGIPPMQVSTSNLMTDGYIRRYLDTPLQWQTVSIECYIDNPGVDLTGLLQLDFKIGSSPIYDLDSLDTAALRNIDATTEPIKKINNRRRSQLVPGFCSQLTLEPGSEAHNPPLIVRPNTYVDHVWKLKNTLNVEAGQDLWVQHILLDNVKVEYFPDETEPIKKLTSYGLIDSNLAPVFEDTLLHGDVFYSPDYVLVDELDPNYEKLMEGHFTLFDGSATYGGWFRRGVNENKFYHELYNKMVRGQFALPRWLLSGSWDTREVLPSFANIFFEPTSARVFLPMSLSVDPKNMITEFEIRESLKGNVTDEAYVPEPVDNPDNNFEQFSDEFSDEFA